MALHDSSVCLTSHSPGRTIQGMKFWERTTFVVDPKGIIRKVYEKVNPEGHERVLLDDINSMKAKAA